MRREMLGDDAWFDLYPNWLAPARAEALMATLLDEVAWEQRHIEVFGREVLQPRLVAWVGDPDAVYTYSRTRHLPNPWTPTLAQLRDEVSAQLGAPFNSVLCNLYRDGHDSMGMHSDAEPELGQAPLIASLSLGQTRRFVLRPRRKGQGHPVDLELHTGSLLVMGGQTQRVYRHGVPKQPGVQGARINLTFRWVRAAR